MLSVSHFMTALRRQLQRVSLCDEHTQKQKQDNCQRLVVTLTHCAPFVRSICRCANTFNSFDLILPKLKCIKLRYKWSDDILMRNDCITWVNTAPSHWPPTAFWIQCWNHQISFKFCGHPAFPFQLANIRFIVFVSYWVLTRERREPTHHNEGTDKTDYNFYFWSLWIEMHEVH